MVLESLVGVKFAQKQPHTMLVLGFLYASIGVFLAAWIFPSSPSLPAVFLTTMAAIPTMVRALKIESKEGEKLLKRYIFIGPHMDIFLLYSCLFVGFLSSFVFWYTILPTESSLKLFSAQIETIRAINGAAIFGEYFNAIFYNNIKVLMFCILFSFLYGAGAVFILCWNASVIATAIGNLLRNEISKLAGVVGMESITGYFMAVNISFARYLLHGFPEVFAYLLGGIAGGIISAAVVRHNIKSREFLSVVVDSIDLIIIAFSLLILGAFIEVGISPVLGV